MLISLILRQRLIPSEESLFGQAWDTMNFFLADVYRAISHGAVLQKELKGADEKCIMDHSNYSDDLLVMDNTEEGCKSPHNLSHITPIMLG